MELDPAADWPEVIAGYWRHMTKVRAAWPGELEDESDFWAWEAVDAVWARGVPQAIDELVQLADAVPDRDLLDYLAGGPLEDLVQLWDDEYNDDIVAAAERSPNFRTALSFVHPTPNALVLWERLGFSPSDLRRNAGGDL